MDTPKDRSGAIGVVALVALLLVTSVVLAERLIPDGRFVGGKNARGTNLADSRVRPSAPPSTASRPRASASPSTSTPAEHAAVSIAGVGDVVMGSAPHNLPPRDADGFFGPVTPALKAQVVTGNLDDALSDNTSYTKCAGSHGEGCYSYRVPPGYAKQLKSAGFTVLSLANNHALDAGYSGLADTKKALRSQGIDYTGMPKQVTLQQVNVGSQLISVAVVGFGPYSWSASITDIPAAVQLVQAAASQADLVVVNMHGGAEGSGNTHVKAGTETYMGENRGDVQKFAHAVVDAGADVVLGHGPSVLRGMEWYKGRLIAYSLGNFAGYKTLNNDGVDGIGAVLTVSLRPDGSWVSGELVGTQLGEDGLPSLDSQNRARSIVGRLSTQDFAATAVHVADDGKLTPP